MISITIILIISSMILMEEMDLLFIRVFYQLFLIFSIILTLISSIHSFSITCSKEVEERSLLFSLFS